LDEAREREAAATTAAAGPDQEKTLVCPDSDLHRPRHIGKYLVTRYLGHGAMGRVFLGQHPELELQIAVKVIDERHAADPRYRRQFLQEARLASQINHPNVIRIYDADQDGDTCFIVQEYVDGGDLAALIRKTSPGGMPVREALRLATGVASGLAAAEKLHIVHRDVKPSNILLTRAGEPKLADLGLARKIRDADEPPPEGSLTRPGSTVGTPAYMAPEQILATGQVDIRADIYALGATLYEMVTGQPPFPGTSTEDVLRRHLHDPVRDPREISPKLPRRVARLIMRMLSKRPEDRQPSAAVLLHELERHTQPYPKRRLLGWSVGLALGLALLAVLLTQRGSGQDEGLTKGLSLLSRGQYDRALPHLQAARQRLPHDKLVLYALGLCRLNLRDLPEAEAIRQDLGPSKAGSELADLLSLRRLVEPSAPDAVRATMAMVCELDTLAKARAVATDDWSSTPTILLFLPVEGTALAPTSLAAASAWLEGLETSMVQRNLFPVVNRSAMDHILRELQLSVSDLVDPPAQIKVGSLLPASVLLRARFSEQGGLHLSLELVEVETSKVIGVITRDSLDAGLRQTILTGLADEVLRLLAERDPAQGRIETVTGDEAEIDIGRCHGLVTGQELVVFAAPKGASARRLGRAKVTARATVGEVDKFSATVRLHDVLKPPVTPGMRVRTVRPQPSAPVP
jgi:serine/threonine protein kinase